MIDINSCRESMSPVAFGKSVVNRIETIKSNPDYFSADGLVCFCGPQGSGKTLSAVNYVYRLMEHYPAAKLVTNILLRDYPIVTYQEWFDSLEPAEMIAALPDDPDKDTPPLWEKYVTENRVFEFRDNDDFSRYNNGDKGVIFLVDEIQLYLNSLESKNVNMDVLTQISQQRKQRKHIVCTSQVFGRMAKPLREQFSCIILCKAFLRFIQCNRLIDRDSLDDDNSTGTNLKGTVKKKFWWVHTPDMYGRYDTYYIIDRNKFVSGEQQRDIYSDPDGVTVDLTGKKKKK